MAAENAYVKSLYEKQDDEELLALHGDGTLTDSAYGVLEEVLRARGVTVPARPQEAEVLARLPSDPMPKWLLVCLFIAAVFVLHFIWIAFIQHYVRGAIPQFLFTVWPLFFLKGKLSPRKRNRPSPARHSQPVSAAGCGPSTAAARHAAEQIQRH